MSKLSDDMLSPKSKAYRRQWIKRAKKEGSKYFVLKVEDFLEAITDIQAIYFNNLLIRYGKHRIKNGKPPFNDYWVVNQDEPFADVVKSFIEDSIGETIFVNSNEKEEQEIEDTN